MKAFLVVAALCLSISVAVRAADVGTTPANASPEPLRQVLVLLDLPPPHFRPDGHYATGYADPIGRAGRQRTAAELARRHGLTLETGWPMPLLGLDCYVMNVPGTTGLDDVAAQVARDPRVAWAQPMHLFRALGHDDPLFDLQPAAREWQLGALHGTATGRNVRVAIVDSAPQRDHPDLADRIAVHENFASDTGERAEAHGTAVAGIVAARADNGIGIAGVAPHANLLAMRACREAAADDTRCSTLGLALAMHAAIERGAQVINLSLGGPPDRLIGRLVETALGRNIGVVAAADRSQPGGGFPAAERGVLAVVDETAGPAPPGMVAAPGTDVPTTLPGSRWGTVSGASFAAAHVSGLLADMLEAQGAANGARESIVRDLVTRVDGRIDACASLMRAGGRCACDCETAPRPAGSDPR